MKKKLVKIDFIQTFILIFENRLKYQVLCELWEVYKKNDQNHSTIRRDNVCWKRNG